MINEHPEKSHLKTKSIAKNARKNGTQAILHILTANTQYQGTLPYNIFIHCILYHKS